MQFPNAVYIPKVSHSGRSKEGAKGPVPPPPPEKDGKRPDRASNPPPPPPRGPVR